MRQLVTHYMAESMFNLKRAAYKLIRLEQILLLAISSSHCACRSSLAAITLRVLARLCLLVPGAKHLSPRRLQPSSAVPASGAPLKRVSLLQLPILRGKT